MNILYIYAHPEPRSFNGSLKDVAMVTLAKNGHAVKVSNLYAMKWKAVLDAQDFRMRRNPYQFNPAVELLACIGGIAGKWLAFTEGRQPQP